MNAKLNSKGEILWQELRQHLDWNDGFALFFYFSSNIALTDIFKQRLQQFFIGHTTRLKEIYYQPDPEWLLQSMVRLLNREEGVIIPNAPVWLALHHDQDEDSLEQYRRLLMRLNERRDVWRASYPAPMIIILPEIMKSTLGALVPDLWSIRTLAENLGDELLQQYEHISQGQSAQAEVITGNRFSIPPSQKIRVDEWLRLQAKQERISTERIRVGGRAVEVWLRYGWFKEANELAEKLTEWSRELVDRHDTPESLRDLSVSLDNVGKVAQQQGRWGDAQSAYEESLEIRRRLCALLGDTPESLRDLSVSLNMVGQVAQQQGRWGDAQSAYEESLEIRRRLCALLGDTPESLRDLAISNQNLALLNEAMGENEQAAKYFHKELKLGKRLTAMLPGMHYFIEIETFSRRKIKELTGLEVE